MLAVRAKLIEGGGSREAGTADASALAFMQSLMRQLSIPERRRTAVATWSGSANHPAKPNDVPSTGPVSKEWAVLIFHVTTK